MKNQFRKRDTDRTRVLPRVMTGAVILLLMEAGLMRGVPADAAGAYQTQKEAALSALSARLQKEREAVYVYKDFGLTQNHYTQKAKMAGHNLDLVLNMDENWQENPYAGESCIRCEQITREGDWGGWLFLNGFLPKGESVPHLNDGIVGGQGLDLTGANALRFYARGETGTETVEFFTCGFGYSGETGFRTVDRPDSCTRQSLGRVTLTQDWQAYEIDLTDADLSYIVCGFGYVLNDVMDGNADNVFYLDEIRFTGEIAAAQNAPVILRHGISLGWKAGGSKTDRGRVRVRGTP